jgi:hypothetical protein
VAHRPKIGTAGLTHPLDHVVHVCEYRVMRQKKHWWNGYWGSMARRDVLMFEDGDDNGGHWWVEARSGGTDGRSRWWELPDEGLALELARDLMSGDSPTDVNDDWRELPVGM